MEDMYLKPLKELDYANLNDKQEIKLRELEEKFNNEFKTDYYLMAMKREH